MAAADVGLAVAGVAPAAALGGGLGRFRTFARQAAFFVAIGAVVTAGNALLYLTLRQWLAIVPANAIAIATTTLLSTELNRRLTFSGARSRHAQVAVQNALVFGYYFAYSGATLGLLHVLVDRPTTRLEAGAVFAASALGGIARFALLRWWVFRAGRPQRTHEERRVRVGLVLQTRQQQVATEARTAEERGFDLVSSGEHLFFHSPHPNAFVVLAAAAGATERIRLLSSLTILPVYPAALAAKLAATVDQVSGGRFDLGVGVGGEFPPEFEAAGIPVSERGARTDESLEVLTRLFAGERLDFEGRFTRIPAQVLEPSPVQRPRPPIWVGGRKGAAMRRAGRFGDVWLPYMYTPEQLASSLARVREAAAEHGRDPAEVRGAIYCWGAVHADGRWARQLAIDTVSATYRQDFAPLADRYLLTGTPEQVLARLREYADAGAETLVFSPAGDGADGRAVVDTLGEEVLPAAHRLTVGAS